MTDWAAAPLDASPPEGGTRRGRGQAAANLWDFVVRSQVADTTPTPSDVIDVGPTRTVLRYVPPAGAPAQGNPVLLVPPLGSQARCLDLRRGCSLAEHLVDQGRPTYLVDYGDLTFADRVLGLEHWMDEVLPAAIRAVSEDCGSRPVHLVGWCLGGLLSLGTTALHPELPVRSVAMVASPFDFAQNPLFRPLRAIGRITNGSVVRSLVRVMGLSPAWLTSAVFRATAATTYFKKPLTLWRRRNQRDVLAQIEAVDGLMNNMLAYPGRAVMQAYSRLLHNNELATGRIEGVDRTLALADVRVPVMNIAGRTDVLAPVGAVHHVGELVPHSPDVRLHVAPGGHLGVLTGSAARDTTWRHIDEFLEAHA